MAEGEGQPERRRPEGSRSRRGRRRQRNLVISVLVIVVLVVSASVGIDYAFTYSQNSHDWDQWGMKIHPPAGVTPRYQGLESETADNASGRVSWTWNDNRSSLILLWFYSTAYNYTSGFEGLRSNLQTEESNVSLLDQGSFGLGQTTWQYQTYRYLDQGVIEYATYALGYYNNAVRVYGLAYVDNEPDTLSSVMSYGQTFSG